MDNTYKVNRFNLPLMQVTGISALHTNFSVAFGLAAREDIEAYTWFLSALRAAQVKAQISHPSIIITDFESALKTSLRNTFPYTQQQICVWHILKNIVLNIKKKWNGSLEGCEIIKSQKKKKARKPTAKQREKWKDGDDEIEHSLPTAVGDDKDEQSGIIASQALQSSPSSSFDNTADGILKAWTAVIRASSEEEFLARWNHLCATFPDQQPILDYLNETYMPWRDQFADYALKTYLNFGI